jgi:outer membrane receptor protein involved in Fe transport
MCFIALAFAVSYSADEEINLSLNDLLNLKIDAGTLTGMARNRVPVSLTTITAEDIKVTPARNLYDLVEIYVPGALWLNHHDGPHPGMRGIIVDRNYKFLMLVNGKVLNQKAYSGAVSELENWDLADIDKVEIIRGPGSVTYGPGAVMGVINITTKNAATSKPGISLGYTYPYRSAGGQGQYGFKLDDKKTFDMYGYFSLVRSKGFTPTAFQGDDGRRTDLNTFRIGYVGTDDFLPVSTPRAPANRYFADFDDRPQIKGYLETEFLKDFTLWARYTQSGTTTNGVNSKLRIQRANDFTLNFKQLNVQQISANLGYKKKLNDLLEINAALSGNSMNFEKWNSAINDSTELYSPRNANQNFAENGILGRALAKLSLIDRIQLAAGLEYAVDECVAGWGDDPTEYRVGDNQNIMSGTNSKVYYNGTGPSSGKINAAQAVFTGDDGFRYKTLSLLFEANIDILKNFTNFTALLSGRADKCDMSKWMLSPRLALVYDINPKNIIKLIGQQSVRMNTGSQLFLQDIAGKESDPEVLKGIEFIYSAIPTKDLNFGLSSYYNNIEALAWEPNTRSTRKAGVLDLLGFEAEGAWTTEKVTLGANHSFTKMLDWELDNPSLPSGLSYSEFNQRAIMTTTAANRRDTVWLYGYGENLNNWSNNTTKLFARVRPVKGLQFHFDTRIFWSFEGGQDGLSMIENVQPNRANDTLFARWVAPKADSLAQFARDKGIYGLDWRFNASVSYTIRNITATLYCMNLFGYGDNKRYSYDAGVNSPTPHRVAFVEEPRTIGLTVGYEFK